MTPIHALVAHARRLWSARTGSHTSESSDERDESDPTPEAPPEAPDESTDGRLAVETPGDLPAPPRGVDSKADFAVATGFTPEEYVIRALDASDGRLEQPAIVELVGLSEHTVSRSLCEMERCGRITRFRIGRRNVVCLPDATPEVGTDPTEVPTPAP